MKARDTLACILAPEREYGRPTSGRTGGSYALLLFRTRRNSCSFVSIRVWRHAFTLIELLTVIAILGLLAGLVFAALSTAQGRAHQIACVSNLKQFAVALQLYANDHDDRLPPNADGREEALGTKWVEGWLGLPGPDCTNTLFLRRSVIGPYLTEVRVWRCPSAEPVTVAGITQARVRTVALNCFMGSPVTSPAARTYIRLADVTQPTPSQAITFVEERVETINDGSFALQWDFDPSLPRQWVLRDKPGVLHRNGATLTFADGHAEEHRWKDNRTIAPPRNDALMSGNADVLWMQNHSTRRANWQ